MQWFEYKLILVNAPKSLISKTFVLGIEPHNCLLTRMKRNSAFQRKKAEMWMQKVGPNQDSVSKHSALIESLIKNQGLEGPEHKKWKFGEQAMKFLSISANVESAKIKGKQREKGVSSSCTFQKEI